MLPKKRKATDEEESFSGDHARKLGIKQQSPPSTEVSLVPSQSLKLSEEECKKYTFKNPYPQQFALPENIIFYIARNPTSIKCHQNVIKSCKLLFKMSRIIPIKDVQDSYQMGRMYVNVNLKKNKKKSIALENQTYKFWIYDKLDIYRMTKYASTLCKHIYKCELQELSIKNQDITFSELQILVDGGKLEKVTFIKNNVKKYIGFGQIFETIFCKDMYFEFKLENYVNREDKAAQMIKILESRGNECSIKLSNIPQSFNITVFSDFLKANMNNDRQHAISLSFAITIDAAYRNQLQQLVDEIIQIRGIYAHTVPLIHFFGENSESKNQLQKMRNGSVEGIWKKA